MRGGEGEGEGRERVRGGEGEGEGRERERRASRLITHRHTQSPIYAHHTYHSSRQCRGPCDGSQASSPALSLAHTCRSGWLTGSGQSLPPLSQTLGGYQLCQVLVLQVSPRLSRSGSRRLLRCTPSGRFAHRIQYHFWMHTSRHPSWVCTPLVYPIR